MSQSVSEVFPNTPDPLNIESCGLLLCLPSSNENATSARVHCQRQWTGHSIRFSATHPLVLLHDTNRFNDTSLVLMADAWGVRAAHKNSCLGGIVAKTLLYWKYCCFVFCFCSTLRSPDVHVGKLMNLIQLTHVYFGQFSV
eukprot:m.54575 g.54575  ORF g.54575 m.54575 type:complete len:141 (-) comp12880_c0_seq3:359-781(-)